MTTDKKSSGTDPNKQVDQREDNRPPQSNRLLLGFLYGAAAALLLGGLFLWANRDIAAPSAAGPRPDASATTPSMPSVAQAHQESDADLSATAAAEIAMLRSHLEANPDDTAARKQLALRLLENQHLVDAFDEAEKVLKADPNNADALYVEGVVRVAMGQGTKAIDLLDRVLAKHPDHVLALIAKGRAQAGLGDLAGAIATWKRGLTVAGGHQAEIEQLLAQAQSDATAPRAATPETTPAPTSSPVAPALVAPATPTAEAGSTATEYDVHVALAPGTRPAAGAVLFVALHGGGAGPPAAVKRIGEPTFPLDVSLSQADSMMGQPLPASGTLVVRLDADGDAISRGPDDLEATAQARAGEPARVTLGASSK